MKNFIQLFDNLINGNSTTRSANESTTNVITGANEKGHAVIMEWDGVEENVEYEITSNSVVITYKDGLQHIIEKSYFESIKSVSWW